MNREFYIEIEMSSRHYVAEDKNFSASTHLVKWWFKTFLLNTAIVAVTTQLNETSFLMEVGLFFMCRNIN